MSEMITFDDLEQATTIGVQKPFFAIDLSNDDVVLNWLKDELLRIRNLSTTRLEKAKNNYLRYKGMQYFNAVYYPRDVLETQRKYTPQLVLPMISDYIDEKVARIMEFKPVITVLPMNDETKDKVDAKIAKKFLKHVDRKEKIDEKLRKILRNSEVAGESFIWTRWNPDLGEKLQETMQVKTLDDGQPVMSELSQGDVEVINKTVNYVFYENAESWDKVNYCYVIELDYVDALKLDYPDKADKISADQDAKVFDYDNMEQIDLLNKCRKIHFYHKKTKYMPEGYEACFTMTCLLKKGKLSYQHGELPIDRLVAVENDEELHGQSSIDKVRAIASNVNNLLNSVIKMFMIAGYAKWFVEEGSVDKQQLNNDVNIVNVKKGAQKPILAQANPVGQSHFEFVDKFINWFYKFSKSNSVVRGEPPAGVTAGVALQYVSESESRRLTTDVAKFNQVVRSINEKILKTCAQYYRTTDERTMMILGKENRWENEKLDVSAIKNNYAVEIQNTSGLSDSKAVRTQQVIDLADKYPDLLPREQVIEMTGLAQAEKAYDVASVAAKAAEDENELMNDKGEFIEPSETEDHLTHWRIHVQDMQSLAYKLKAPPEVIAAKRQHLAVTEMMMIDKGIENPVYREALLQLKGFPMLAELPPLPPTMMPPAGVGPAQQPMPEAPLEVPEETGDGLPREMQQDLEGSQLQASE